ncbi:ABC transporter [Curtobacterium sp. YC1]|uniref:ABC transporter n=1 Tax=Curtobacterium sp. YC1 TaxID=2795488 RepID=UPI0018E596BD|nr:ABC transporter [Curtobacterium sp. YC1]QQD76406.1 ABC transporter [Curtobacterium sp. YC1]
MTHSTIRRAPARILSTIGLATGLALTVTACSTGTPSADDATASARPHGYVEGASEAQEPQVRLLAVSATGETALHDLLTEESTELDGVDAPEHSATDGRFLVTSDGDRTTIVDGGSWTVDHGDHTHYYAADPRVVGTIDRGGPVEVHSSETMTTLTWPDRGEAVVLDREALGQGEVDETARVDATVLLPVGEQLVAAQGDTVRVLDADGDPADTASADGQTCTDPAGGIVTRAGAVVGCTDGAVVVDDAGATSFVELPDDAERPTAFAARSGRPTVAGLAGDTGFWLLDVREGSWRHVPTERPLRAVVAVDDEDEHVVGVDADGRVVVVTASDGTVATTEPLVEVDGDTAPLLQLDAQRAYLADPASGTVHEIDFADDARVARTVDLPVAPLAFAEVGL